MRNLRIADPDFKAQTISRLGDRLIRLDTEHETNPPEHLNQSPTAWQEQWSAGSEQISSRLTLIEAELDRLAADGPEQPLLSVFDSELDS